MSPIRFHLNGRPVEVSGIAPTTTLLDWLRQDRRLTGTKEGCAEGDCGACTVAVLDHDGAGSQWRAVCACILLVPMVHGRHVVTVEGLARDGELHPAQDALVRELGSQCGYCTPGVVMSMFEACYRQDLDADWKVDDQLCGNLCRCTGYRPIRDAARAVAGIRPADPFLAALDEASAPRALDYAHGAQRFVLPATWDGLLDAVDAGARLVCGATDLGLDVTKKHARFPLLASTDGIAELREIRRTATGWSIGAAVRLTDLEAWAERELPVLARMLRFFGSRQIKHGATLGGNVCNASPIGDTPPVLLALDATLVARGRAGERRIPIDAFFLAYRKTALEPGEVLARVEIPLPSPTARLAAYKVSKRRELDISAVAAAFAVDVVDGVVRKARLAYGGMAAVPSRAAAAEAALIGHPWTEDAVRAAMDALAFTPLSDHRGSAWYRDTVARNLLLGFFHETRTEHVPRLPDRPTATLLGPGGAS